ncbi:MAG: hypothetical protein P8010_01060 [Desulfosarcinaceae bacterium]|jgi:hypothetical protein
MTQIGQLNEKSLHAALKAACARPGDRFEVPVDGYVIDIVRGNLLVEIQTGNFTAIKTKLVNLLHDHRLRLVYPIAKERYIVKPDAAKRAGFTRRKSPKRGRPAHLFAELVRIPHLLGHPNFSLEVLLIREEEVRRYAGGRHWRKRGWVTEERRLLEIVDKRRYDTPADLEAFLPNTLSDRFTTRNIAEELGITLRLAQCMAYCLRRVQVIEMIGKQGHANLYALNKAAA